MLGVVDRRHLLRPIKYCPPLAYCLTVVDVLCNDVTGEIKKTLFYSAVINIWVASSGIGWTAPCA